MIKSIKTDLINEIIIEKSRFICKLVPVQSAEEAEIKLNEIKKEHWDATHNCSAYIIGWKQEVAKCRDDGEPSRTAGFPMLEVLKNNNMTNILAVVTRYFGGIKLGAGGLVRAYGNSVSKALECATFTTIKNVTDVSVVLKYPEFETVKYYLDNNELQIIGVDYSDNVAIKFEVDEVDFENVKRDLIEILKTDKSMSFSKTYSKEVIMNK